MAAQPGISPKRHKRDWLYNLLSEEERLKGQQGKVTTLEAVEEAPSPR